MQATFSIGISLQDDDEGKFLVEHEIIYDGILRFNKKFQSRIKDLDGEIIEYPEPIIIFILSEEVNADGFLSGARGSCVRFPPIAQEENDEDGLFYEDHNGYSSVWEDKEGGEIINRSNLIKVAKD